MDEILQKLYNECIEELKSINIDILDAKNIGEIDIKIAKRNAKRYGCCKQEEPDLKTCYYTKRGRHRITNYRKFNKHHIEISKWVMKLEDKIIKNTIIHEIIHCLPDCNNHGDTFKKYAKDINQKLGYNIKRLGNREADCKKSNIDFKEDENFKYKIVCEDCGQIFLRKRLKKDFTKKYRCGKCKGNLKIFYRKDLN